MGMREACVLVVGLGRVGHYVLARFGDMRTCNAALLAREAGTSFFAYAAAASSSAQLAGNGPLPDTVGELLLLRNPYYSFFWQKNWDSITYLEFIVFLLEPASP